jgi:hypothetical protein
MTNRNFKIETAMNKVKQRQEAELNALLKKLKQGLDELGKARKEEEAVLALKYANLYRDLRMRQDKEVLGLKGQFKSKGGATSSPQISKNKSGIK